MRTAQEIVADINRNTDLFLAEKIDWREHSDTNMNLWNEASASGVFEEVDTILQAQSLQEMTDAMKSMGIEWP